MNSPRHITYQKFSELRFEADLVIATDLADRFWIRSIENQPLGQLDVFGNSALHLDHLIAIGQLYNFG